MKPDGSLHSIHHTIDEKAPGANLSKEEAQTRAEVFLRDRKGVNLADWNLVVTRTDKKPARTDHFFEWEQKTRLDAAPGQPAAAGAHTRIQLQVQGDEVSGYRVFIKIPETWRDAESRQTPAQLAQRYGLALGIGVALIAVLVIFLRSLKSPEVARVTVEAVHEIVAVDAVGGDRDLRKPAPSDSSDLHDVNAARSFYVTILISLIFITAIYVAGGVLLPGLAWFFVERAFGPGRIPKWREWKPEYFRDAFFVGLFGSGAAMGLLRLPALFARWPVLHHTLAADVPENLDLLNPAAGALASAIATGFLAVGLLGLAAGLIAAHVRGTQMRAGLMILYAVLMATNVATRGAFMREAAFQLLVVAAIWYGVAHITRFNVLGYFLLAAMITLVSSAMELLKQPNSYLHANGYAVIVFAIAILAWPLTRWQRSQ